jgi:hypothetical protein
VFIAGAMVFLMGMAALVIDATGLGYNEKRQDQTAADVGVMAGAIETPGSTSSIRDQILDFVQRNVDVERTPAEWQAEWESCTDGDRANLNASGFNFVPVDAPASWTVSLVDCISIDQAGFVRVQLPDLEFGTSFGRVIGFDDLETTADAIATIVNRGGGSILPFGLLETAGNGDHMCLETGPSGISEPPCDGASSGNFGVVVSPQYGNVVLGTTQNCTASPKKDVLTLNISVGIDHLVWTDEDGLAANEILDTCAEMDAGNTPDTLDTQTGNAGTVEGLATGPIPGGIAAPRLQQGPNPKTNVHGFNLDDKPLWEYIDPGLGTPAIPASCVRSSFDNSLPDFDWDGDGTDDLADSWQHMAACLNDYVSGGHSAVMFLESISESPRFAYVPQFHESDWPSGTSGPRHILRFKSTFLETTWWKKGAATEAFHPGDGLNHSAGGPWQMIQISGFVIPDSTLPEELRGDPLPVGGLNPYDWQLYD